ncbi:MAG: twin-arginine translocase TatA/TatE family subunit [Verrucomicrobiia bacterium]
MNSSAASEIGSLSLNLAFSPPGGVEWVVIFTIVLLLFGAKKLPGLARAIAESLREFRKVGQQIDDEISKGASDIGLEPPKGRQLHQPKKEEV